MNDLYSAAITIKGVGGELRVSEGQLTVTRGASAWSCAVSDVVGYTAKKPGLGGGYLCIEALHGLPAATGLGSAMGHRQAVMLNTYGKWSSAQPLMRLLDSHAPGLAAGEPASAAPGAGVAAKGVPSPQPPQHVLPDETPTPVEDLALSAVGEKTCPYCAETIKAAAIKCRYCHSDLLAQVVPDPRGSGPVPGSGSDEGPGLWPFWAQNTALFPYFQVELESTHLQPIGGELAFFVVSGLIKNWSDGPWSFHLSIHGRRDVGGELFQVAMFGQTDTPVLGPGQVGRWVAKLVVTPDAHPDSLRYQVEVQRSQGEIEVNRIDSLESPDQLGGMADVLLGQVAMTVRSFYGPAPEGDRPLLIEPTRLSLSAGLAEAPFAPSASPSAVMASVSSEQVAASRPWPYRSSAVPLVEWKGMSRMTRQPTVPACCNGCGFDWSLDSSVSNTIAQELGMAGRLQRRGKAMEQFGATFTAGASGRRIAAGNELQRMDDTLVTLFTLAACPSCGGTDVLLAKG